MITSAFGITISFGLTMLNAFKGISKLGSKGFSFKLKTETYTHEPSSFVRVKLKNCGDMLTFGSSFSAQIPDENMKVMRFWGSG